MKYEKNENIQVVGFMGKFGFYARKIFPQLCSKMYLGYIYTISVNLAGLPGISVPCGYDGKGLPIGLQLIGDCFKEKNIIRAAYTFEQTHKYQRCPLAEM